MSSASESAGVPNPSEDVSGNAEKKQEEIAKKKRDFRTRFKKKDGEKQMNATEPKEFEGLTPEIGGILALNSEK